MEEKAFLKTHVESANNCRGTKLPPVSSNLVDFIANCIAPFDYEENFEALVKLFMDELMLKEESCL